MSKISDISFNKVNSILSIFIILDSGVSGEYSISSRKYLKYINDVIDNLIGMEVFD